MDRPDIDFVKARLDEGAYGTMCLAAVARLKQMIEYIEYKEDQAKSNIAPLGGTALNEDK